MRFGNEKFELPAMCMRKPAAVDGTDFVDAAFVVLQVEVLAGRFLVHDVAALVVVQVFFEIFLVRHADMRCNAFHFHFLKRRRHCAAAVGAFQAIDFFESLLVETLRHRVDATYFAAGKSAQELLQFLPSFSALFKNL